MTPNAAGNAKFVHVVNRGTLRMRVWERGVGATLACGTGAVVKVYDGSFAY